MPSGIVRTATSYHATATTPTSMSLRTTPSPSSTSSNYRTFDKPQTKNATELRVPSSWQKFNTETGLHPTQKPVDLFRYLIRTYTNKEDLVLDNCMGSGTTAIAALREGRHFVGFELNEDYYDIAVKRIKDEQEHMYKIS